jgi:hypothetical protein
MPVLKTLLSIFTVVMLLTGCATTAILQEEVARDPEHTVKSLDETRASCPITQAPEAAFIPPAPFPPKPPERYGNEFWYGTPDLWTMLGTGGTWSGLPLDKSGYSQKVFWWSQHFNVKKDPFPPLTVMIEHLDVVDSSSPILVTEQATNASADFGTAMLTGVELPTPGCWKITGQYQDWALSFVVWVIP